jgi:uncharacterized protein (TIGR03435 family)
VGRTFGKVLLSGFVLGASVVLLGQTQSNQNLAAFEVAAVKPTDLNDSAFTFRIEPDGTTAASGITLKRLLMTAYNVQGFRVVGGPSWIDSERWDIHAKHDGKVSIDQIRQMLVGLIADRFHLRAHRDTRTLRVYELVVERGGAKVAITKDSDVKPIVQVMPGYLQLTNATSGTFASQLSYAVGRPVSDKTHLVGTFDFILRWMPVAGEDGGPTTAGLPPGADETTSSHAGDASIFTAVREQLGLRLKSARGAADVVVIDHVERPTPD